MVKPVVLLLAVSLCGEYSVQAQPFQSVKTQGRLPGRKRLPDNAHQRQSESFDKINKILWWLPENTETISVAQGPFKTVAPISEPPPNMPAIKLTELLLQMASSGGFPAIQEHGFYKSLMGHTVMFSIAGSRKFREPTSLGGMKFEGCDILVFQKDLGTLRDTLLKQMGTQAKQVLEIAGQQVALFEEKLEEDLWNFYVAIPEPNILLCATDQDYLTEVLNRMHQRGENRALPATLPEWKQIDTGAKFWAVRHYDKEDAQFDSTSPLSGEQKAANVPDMQAIGLTFSFDPAKSKIAKVKYLSANKEALKIARKLWIHEGEGFNPAVRKGEAGVIEILVSFDHQTSAGVFLFVLQMALGHGVYV